MLLSIFGLSLHDFFYYLLFISDTNSFPRPLSSTDERKYFEKMKEGDESARHELIEKNLRLVAHIIKKYYSSYNDQDDLISIGTIGLIKAVDSYDYNKGTRLATYAARCIENEILMHFRNVKKTSVEVSLNEPIETSKDGNNLSLMDILASEDTILDDLDTKIKLEKLSRIIGESLDKREMSVIVLRYGLGFARPLTQRETAQKLGISRSYVSRIEKKALDILKASLS